MSKYTKDDPDVKELTSDDRIFYDFELLKYNVDANQEAYVGAQSVQYLRNPNKMADMFKSPLKFTVGLFALICYVLIVVILIFIVVMIILSMVGGSENKIRVTLMKWMALYMFVALMVVVGLYWFLNKIVVETTALGFVPRPL